MLRILVVAALISSSCALEMEGVGPADVRQEAIESGAVRERWRSANQLAVSGAATCAVLGEARELSCWGLHIVEFLVGGERREGAPCPQLQELQPRRSCATRPLPMRLDNVVQVRLTNSDGCAVEPGGEVTCWRIRDSGCADCGVPRLPRMELPHRVSELETAVRLGPCLDDDGWYAVTLRGSIAASGLCDDPGLRGFEELIASYSHSCARRDDGSVWCWGLHNFGNLGLGESPLEECRVAGEKHPCAKRPTRVPGIGSAIQLAGNGRTCVVMRDGSVWCWGQWDESSLKEPRWRSPQLLPGLERITRVVVGRVHLCALDMDGAARCLGSNRVGQLGDGTLTSRDEPKPVGLPLPAIELAAGDEHTCAVLADRSLYCWGANNAGQLGDGTFEDRSSPVQTLPPGSVSQAPREPRARHSDS